MFDSIIVVKANEEVTLKRLEKRNGNIAPLLKEINKDNMVLENESKAELIITNDLGLSELKKRS